MFKLNKKGLLLASVTTFLFACSATQSDVPIVSKDNAAPPKVIKAVQPLPTNIQSKRLTLEQIMADPDWMGRQPTSAYWADDSEAVFYKQKQLGSPLSDLWTKSINEQGNGNKIELSALHLHAYEKRIVSQNKQMTAWVFEGNVFVKNLANNQLKQLTKDNKQPYNLVFLNDGRLSFQSGDAIYAIHPEDGLYEQLVSWQFADEPKALDEPEDYIAEQQQQLIEVVALKRQQKELRFKREQQLALQNNTLAPADFYFPEDNETVEASLSPNGKWLVLVEQEESSWRDDGDIMPNYINEDGRITTDNVRRRVADAQPVKHNIWLLNLDARSKRKISYNSLPGYNEDVLETVKRENAAAKGENYIANRLPRDISLMQDWYWSQGAIQWHSDGENVAIMLEAWDNKDRWLATIDTDNAILINQHRLHDNAWVNYKFNSFGWLNTSTDLYYLSEETGYSHLYLKPLNGQARAVTSGKFEVDSLTLTSDDQFMYFKGNKKHPGIYEIYRVALADNTLQEITHLNGMTDYQLSPDEQSLLLTHSSLVRPPELYWQSVAKQSAMQLTQTSSQAFLDINWLAPDIVPIKSSHTEHPIYSRVYTPRDMQAGQKYKAVVFNHGAGYLQNSHLGWSGYFREFMFHNLLVQQGYVVLDMDYRASAGYGRDWRTAIYRQMGTPEIQDLEDGVDWLVENLDVDAKRVGTYGGSYGGFMTFMALFNSPDLFQAGAALRPVSDWAHYNHGYTSNILNTPDVDPIAYERSSPIYFAEGLENPLLINAPMIDSNVFFVDVVRLVQRLIELEKQDFETAIYPVESHGFVQPSSWLDEYRRIYKLFETNL
ncbi:prolyl oligopeptidase family serine peptidase [Paraglaciecola sp. MB-3u-78]|uniref:S9 family peptidase n=1 Tax=Paraglaciecola sp. MB-3u-78 TaxID=2058332 RepID=UPI000C33272D|nr:prolyl oligopeptidase family serine peptidase [Paraglaciecola sp. MB-3u-78]PKG99666.1 S9 family peptidase [Paraglaciecola sp. MB-3u-78]